VTTFASISSRVAVVTENVTGSNDVNTKVTKQVMTLVRGCQQRDKHLSRLYTEFCNTSTYIQYVGCMERDWSMYQLTKKLNKGAELRSVQGDAAW